MLSDESFFLSSASQARGTARWMAPELIDGRQHTVTKESDIYAYALTIWVRFHDLLHVSIIHTSRKEIFSGRLPFHQYTNDGQIVMAKVVRQETPEREEAVKHALWELLERCWAFEAMHRPKISEIVSELEKV